MKKALILTYLVGILSLAMSIGELGIKRTEFGELSHRRAAKTETSLRICAASPEPSFLFYIKYGNRGMLRLNIKLLALLGTPTLTSK